ncbi:MAG: Phenylalanyl-tRNA synthetase beta chain (EC [uncultured Sulfurovum sp.]|uniref:Phenylalanine--tRNA ligase beta subunit n=1 Tax=uncultured Sulfurovum sp. TaxID=269237 RepID=A0A6S6SGV9_9BACT|nr:MAG: Phenylalanyl-tRNA synthetase beta chain (EC [uncultured Sulfurovum sp.]
MIITRTWLNNFLDISEVSDDTLYKTLNAIGLEVDSITTHTIPEKIVVGKILSCEKHPDADKLNVCQIETNIGTVRQIVCGAANVVNAEYVAVATIGAKLSEDFEIKHAKLRGVESEGMVCSSSELGLPDIGDGIIILDESIGELVVGKELNDYKKLSDTVIEIELTANRGDCLSVNGVARDLSAALNIPLKKFDYESQNQEKIGLARVAKLTTEGEINASLEYVMASMESLHTSLLFSLRLAFVNELQSDSLANILKYITHTTGVILRAYDVGHIDLNSDEKLLISAKNVNDVVHISLDDKLGAHLGIHQEEELKATEKSTQILFQASYMNPNLLVDVVSEQKLDTDELYYNTSRGSEPNLCFGISYLTYLFENYNNSKLFDGSISISREVEDKIITVSAEEICQIIGNDIPKMEIINILKSLGFSVQMTAEENFGVTIPAYRHDIENIQDITEEVVRIIGIDNIEAKALKFVEKNRTNDSMKKYYAKKELRSRAVAAGFDESMSYAFTDRVLLEKYNFPVVNEELDIINPITADFNTLRTTVIINLLQAANRNVNYSKKSTALFEVGTIFNENREEKDMLSLIYTGQKESENVSNAGKPTNINFESFVKKVSSVIGNFELRTSLQINSIIHPYQSADIIINNQTCGYLTKVHPTVSEDFDLKETFVAEIDFSALVPEHINANPISKFQGVYKDLSFVIDKNTPYSQVCLTTRALQLPLLKKFYAVDVYEDESLGDEKSLSLRLFIQSLDDTLKDEQIDDTVSAIINELERVYGAKLR